MRKVIAAGGLAALAAAVPVAAAAGEAPPHRAAVSAAKLLPFGSVAGHEHVKGRAHLVDGPRNDKATLHVRGLRPRTPYLWHVHSVPAGADPCTPGAPQGPPLPAPWAWSNPVKSNASGRLSAKERTRKWSPAADTTYYVNVHLADGTVIACGVLERRGHRRR